MAESPWPLIHAERRALAHDLAGLDAGQWTTMSCCAGWTVHRTLGHIVATAKMTPGRFVTGFVSAGFRFDRFVADQSLRETAGGPAATLADFTAHLGDTTSPPGPTDAMLGEIVVHATDIRRPLGIEHEFPADTLTRTAAFFQGSNALIGSKKRIAGFTLTATDVDWSIGAGPVVSGPMLSLVHAMTGRAAALADLSGPGLPMFSARF